SSLAPASAPRCIAAAASLAARAILSCSSFRSRFKSRPLLTKSLPNQAFAGAAKKPAVLPISKIASRFLRTNLRGQVIDCQLLAISSDLFGIFIVVPFVVVFSVFKFFLPLKLLLAAAAAAAHTHYFPCFSFASLAASRASL